MILKLSRIVVIFSLIGYFVFSQHFDPKQKTKIDLDAQKCVEGGRGVEYQQPPPLWWFVSLIYLFIFCLKLWLVSPLVSTPTGLT